MSLRSKLVPAAGALFAAPMVLAHPGDAAAAAHWHVPEILGLVAALVAATAAVWLLRRDR